MPTLNTSIKRNADFRLRVSWRDPNGDPIDLTDCTAELQFRLDSGGAKLLDLTTENGGLSLNGAAGTIDILSLAATHGSLPLEDIFGDLLIFNGTATDSPLSFVATVEAGITQP